MCFRPNKNTICTSDSFLLSLGHQLTPQPLPLPTHTHSTHPRTHKCILYIHTYIYTYIHTYIPRYIQVYIHTIPYHTYIHTYTHNMHTHTPSPSPPPRCNLTCHTVLSNRKNGVLALSKPTHGKGGPGPFYLAQQESSKI